MSKIEWTEKTWNPVSGCSKVSPGCKHCYAETMAARIVKIGGKAAVDYEGVIEGKRWTGLFRELPHRLDIPLRRKKPTTWFVNSMSDIFGEGVSFEYITAVFAVMAVCHQHRFQVLTKRAKRMGEWFEWFACQVDRRGWHKHQETRIWAALLSQYARYGDEIRPESLVGDWPLSNVMVGVSAENQDTWDERVPELLACPARWRFVSAEPLLGPIDIGLHVYHCPDCDESGGTGQDSSLCGREDCENQWIRNGLDQVIVGCESRGPALGRPTKIEWIQDLGRQVLDAGVALFVKQADVCDICAGMRWDNVSDGCGSGQAGKLYKDCPAVWIPGYGAKRWRQMPEGW